MCPAELGGWGAEVPLALELVDGVGLWAESVLVAAGLGPETGAVVVILLRSLADSSLVVCSRSALAMAGETIALSLVPNLAKSLKVSSSSAGISSLMPAVGRPFPSTKEERCWEAERSSAVRVASSFCCRSFRPAVPTAVWWRRTAVHVGRWNQSFDASPTAGQSGRPVLPRLLAPKRARDQCSEVIRIDRDPTTDQVGQSDG